MKMKISASGFTTGKHGSMCMKMRPKGWILERSVGILASNLEGYIMLVGNAMVDFACELVESLVEATVGSGTVYNANKGVYWCELWQDETKEHTLSSHLS